MQSAPFTSSQQLTSPPTASDDEFWQEVHEVALDSHARKGARLLPSAWALLAMTVLGVVAALFWRNFDPQLLDARLWSDPSTQPSRVAGDPGSADQLGHLTREVDALKKDISELGVAQQQIIANIAALQAHQELQRKSSFQASWYSGPATLISPDAPAQRR
jgi:uncharacterized protein HemX